MTVWAYVAIVYAVGFLVAPFVISLVDGWPFTKPRLDGLDMSAVFLIALFWPLILVIWGLYVWWVLCSSEGVKAHKAIMRVLEMAARDE